MHRQEDKTDRKGGCSDEINLAFHGLKLLKHADEIKTHDVTLALAINTNTHIW